MAQHEDPPTDVFVGCVNSDLGSFRFFFGSYDDGDFWVERLLNFLIEKQNFPIFPPIIRSTIALLRLSNAIAKRLQLDPYTTGTRKESLPITVPRWNDLLPRVNALFFSQNDLQDLQINERDLLPFVLEDPMRDELIKQTLWGSVFEARPLLRLDGGLVVGAPSSLGRTLVRFMAGEIQGSGMGEWAETFYDQETAHTFVNLSGFNQRVRRLLNVHCVTDHEGAQIARLERFEPNSLFKEDRNQEVYLDTNAHSEGRLVGCVETNNRSWWVFENLNFPSDQVVPFEKLLNFISSRSSITE